LLQCLQLPAHILNQQLLQRQVNVLLPACTAWPAFHLQQLLVLLLWQLQHCLQALSCLRVVLLQHSQCWLQEGLQTGNTDRSTGISYPVQTWSFSKKQDFV
jgi:hypothetical protein